MCGEVRSCRDSRIPTCYETKHKDKDKQEMPKDNHSKGFELYYCLTLILVLLSGCVSSVNMISPITADSQLSAGEGLVVARVVNASGGPLPFNQLTINAGSVQTATINPYTVFAKEPFQGSSTVFSSAVSAGSYSFDSIALYHTARRGWYSDVVDDGGVELGTFVVEPGKVTDLGTIVCYNKLQDGEYIKTLIRIPENEPGSALQKHFDFYQFDKEQVLGWNEDGFEGDRRARYLSATQSPAAFSKKFLAPDETLYF